LQENELPDIAKAIKLERGKATLKTVSGGTLAMMQGKDLIITDENGGSLKLQLQT
jgi:hypothetical protein